MTATLALDLGTNCGWAYRYESGDPKATVSGKWNLKPGRYDGGGMRFVRFIAQLDALHATRPVSIVYFEEVRRHQGVDAAHVYGGLMATLQAWCEGKHIPYGGITVQEIKRFATGKGGGKGADKDAMVAAAKRAGYAPESDDEADALAILALKCGDVWATP